MTENFEKLAKSLTKIANILQSKSDLDIYRDLPLRVASPLCPKDRKVAHEGMRLCKKIECVTD